MLHTGRFHWLIVVALLSAAVSAQAGVIAYSDRSQFNALGTVAYNSNFSDFGPDFSFPGDPWTRGDVTYTTGANVIAGTGTFWYPVENVIANNDWSPLTATVATLPRYDMLGFDFGYLSSSSLMTIQAVTNVATYTWGGLSFPDASVELAFGGAVTTDPSEYFISFSITSSLGYGGGSAPVITNVAVGNTGVVPEPSSLALLAFGAIGLAVPLARRQKAKR